MQTDGNTAPTNDPAPRRHSLRPRAIGLTAMVAAGLAAVLVVGTLVRPASSALAWDPSPTAASVAQKAAAEAACSKGLVVPDGAGAVTTRPGSGAVGMAGGGTVTVEGGAVPVTGVSGPEQGAQESGQAIVVDGQAHPAGSGLPELVVPSMPGKLPPLVYLELHGTGAVAIFADDTTTAYCLLIKQGDALEMAGLLFPSIDGGPSMGVGSVSGMGTTGAVSIGAGSAGAVTGQVTSGVTMAGEGGFTVTAMATAVGDAKVGIIAGSAPDGAASMRVDGGAADGATASVDAGRFALWAPGVMDAATTLVALDASGAEIGRQELAAPPAPPAVP